MHCLLPPTALPHAVPVADLFYITPCYVTRQYIPFSRGCLKASLPCRLSTGMRLGLECTGKVGIFHWPHHTYRWWSRCCSSSCQLKLHWLVVSFTKIPSEFWIAFRQNSPASKLNSLATAKKYSVFFPFEKWKAAQSLAALVRMRWKGLIRV